MIKSLKFLISILLFFACNNSKENELTASKQSSEIIKVEAQSYI